MIISLSDFKLQVFLLLGKAPAIRQQGSKPFVCGSVEVGSNPQSVKS